MTTESDDPEVEHLLADLSEGPPPGIRSAIDHRVYVAMDAERTRRSARQRSPASRSVGHRALPLTLAVGLLAVVLGAGLVLLTLDDHSARIGAPSPSTAVSSTPQPGCGPAEPITAETTPFTKGMNPGRSEQRQGSDATIDDLRAADFIIPLPDLSYGLVFHRVHWEDPADLRATVILGNEPIDPYERDDEILRRRGVSITEQQDTDGSLIESMRMSRMSEAVYDVAVGPHPAILKQSIRWVREQFLWEVWWHADGHDYQVRSGFETGAEALDLARSMVCGTDMRPPDPSPVS